MATQPVVPRLPVCTALLAQLRGEGADPDDTAALLARDGDTLLAGTAAFRRPTSASAAALTAHGFTHDGVGGAPPTKVIIGTATEQLVRDLVPKLVGAARLASGRHARCSCRQLTRCPRADTFTPKQNLEEAQTYAMLRRAYAADASLPAAVDDACLLTVTKTYFRERAALLQCTAQLVALAALGDSASGPAHDALQQLLDKVRLAAVSGLCCRVALRCI